MVAPVGAVGQTTAPQAALSEKKEEQVPVELYQAPSLKRVSQPECLGMGRLEPKACQLLESGTEGWVELGFMVDPSGKPYEVTVIRSTGVKEFEDMAAKAIERSTFVPGMLDGKPIESGYEMKYIFRNDAIAGATPGFVSVYKKVQKAISADDRAPADDAMKELKITNLYEDAYFGLATYVYATKWGDESQQLAGLRRAIAQEEHPKYLSDATFKSILFACLRLEIKTHEYAEALGTARTLQKNKLDKDTAAQVATIVGELEKLRSDGGPYEVPGSMPDGSWHLHLFKKHFQAEVTDGYISQVKLRCPTRYVSFVFDPKLQYTVESKHGACSIELDGAPGTKFKLVQF